MSVQENLKVTQLIQKYPRASVHVVWKVNDYDVITTNMPSFVTWACPILSLYLERNPVHCKVEETRNIMQSYLHDLAPSYLSETLHLSIEVDARRQLRDASTSTLIVPSTRRSTLGDWAFRVAHAWNSLPRSVRSTSSLASFCLHLKTHLFAVSFLADTQRHLRTWFLYSAPAMVSVTASLKTFIHSFIVQCTVRHIALDVCQVWS